MTTFPHQISDAQPPFADTNAEEVVAWIRGKTPADLNAIEFMDRDALVPTTLFPETIRYRNAAGVICETHVMLKIPYEDDLAYGTQLAVQHVAGLHKGRKIETPEQAREYVGTIRFEAFETAAILSQCVRSTKPPHIYEYKLHVFLKTFPPTTIADLWDRLSMLRRLWDVRVSELSEEHFWAFAKEIARVKNIGPLAVLAPALQSVFICRLAAELTAQRTSNFSFGSPEESTREPSEKKTSE